MRAMRLQNGPRDVVRSSQKDKALERKEMNVQILWVHVCNKLPPTTENALIVTRSISDRMKRFPIPCRLHRSVFRWRLPVEIRAHTQVHAKTRKRCDAHFDGSRNLNQKQQRLCFSELNYQLELIILTLKL